MSRLIIKNLPKAIKEDRLKEIFSAYGNITDCSLKFTKDGVFRRFAFIGFQNRNEAENAQKYFNKTFIDTSKIQVEFAKGFGDKEKPRAWSKYSSESSAFKNKQREKEAQIPVVKEITKTKSEKKDEAKEERLKDMLGELKDDPGFEEFLSVHENLSKKSTWTNDALPTQQTKGQITPAAVKDQSKGDDSGNSSASSDEEADSKANKKKEKSKVNENKEEKVADKAGISDLEYLKTKIAGEDLGDDLSSDSSSDDSDDDSSNDDGDTDNVIVKGGHSKSKPRLEEKPKNSNRGDKSEQPSQEANDIADLTPTEKYALKMRGFPGTVEQKAIVDFFKPLVTKEIRIPRNARRKTIGVAYVDFKSEKDLDQALRKNKNFIGGKRIYLKKCETEDPQPKPRPWELKKSEPGEEQEGMGESGRLYVRNLAYVSTEEDLEELFKKYGPLTEVSLPVDKITKKIKGFAHITYMMPEHAVKAYTELDGSVFLGRMMHILPGRPRKEDQLDVTEFSSFKKQKAAKDKASAGSSHNWNSLFLGVNAVADVMAGKYGTSKSQILDSETSQSLGVRMALGETQVVSETRDFLIENGVELDSFSQPSTARSKTVILVKNLSAGTKAEELRDVFSKYGDVGRVVLPPSGISAIIEFLVPGEARAAFTKLAYTKFKHMPLYLEWAPMEVFKPKTTTTEDQTTVREEENMESDEEVPENGNVLFVKNLNFHTREDELKKLFEKCGPIRSVTVAKKKDIKNPGEFLSMGYGFVEYQRKASADEALKQLQYTELDGHQLDLKVSNRSTLKPESKGLKRQAEVKQKSSKILVRNIPFEAKQNELQELFRVFGELKSVRLPKKLGGTGKHRGFGFVDFLTKQDAKRAFKALCHSTHLYGRRLVLEWAEAEENIEELRKKTAEHFHDDSPRKRLKKADLMAVLGE